MEQFEIGSLPHCGEIPPKMYAWTIREEHFGEPLKAFRQELVDIRDLRKKLGDTQNEFAERYSIPFRTVQNWENGVRKPPGYILELLGQRIREDLVNKKTKVFFNGLSVAPEYQDRFDSLTVEAIEYYDE